MVRFSKRYIHFCIHFFFLDRINGFRNKRIILLTKKLYSEQSPLYVSCNSRTRSVCKYLYKRTSLTERHCQELVPIGIPPLSQFTTKDRCMNLVNNTCRCRISSIVVWWKFKSFLRLNFCVTNTKLFIVSITLMKNPNTFCKKMTLLCYVIVNPILN